jgi:hypothetical protein
VVKTHPSLVIESMSLWDRLSFSVSLTFLSIDKEEFWVLILDEEEHIPDKYLLFVG